MSKNSWQSSKYLYQSLDKGRQRRSNSKYSRDQQVKLRTIVKDRTSDKKSALGFQNINSPQQNVFPTISPNNHNTNNDSKTLGQLKMGNALEMQKKKNSGFLLFESQKQTPRKNGRNQTLPSRQINQNTNKNFRKKLQQLDVRAQSLIERKLKKMLVNQSNKNYSLKTINDELNPEFEKLINQIRSLKIEQSNVDDRQLQMLVNKKIRMLEKLLAQKQIESQVLKKYFFAFNAYSHRKNNKGNFLQRFKTVGNDTLHMSLARRNSEIPTQGLSYESANKMNFQAPKPEEYQTYRHKKRIPQLNNQPLPRSSYKSEYLTYSPEKRQLIKNPDNHSLYGSSRQKNSTYSKDYQTLKTQPINYKQLDSYRNKIRDIQISYAGRKKKGQDDEQFISKNKSYLRQQLKQRNNYLFHSKKLMLKKGNSMALNDEVSEQDLLLQPLQLKSKKNSKTQSRRQFTGTQGLPSQIKNKQLTNLKYIYKSMVHS